MRPIKSLISIDEAISLIDENTLPIERTESVDLTEAAGRVTSRGIRSRIDIPPFDRAAMDGYAVKAEDSFGASKQSPVRLKLLGKIHAGEVPETRVVRGACLQIATGAVMPEGADSVIMVEYTEIDAGEVIVSKPVYPGENVSLAGSDIRRDSPIVDADVPLTPAHIGSLAAAGADTVEVYAKPTVTIISTGDEVVKPPRELEHGQVYDVNSYTLAVLLTQNGAQVRLKGPCRDDPASISGCLNDPDADIIIFTGGSSVGERDVLVDALESHGVILFHGIAVKPGKPTLFARSGTQLVFGMPGYPTSCLSNGYMFLVPAVRKMAHLPEVQHKTIRLPIGKRIVSTIGRHQFLTVTVENGVAMPAFKESGAITSMSKADGYIEIPSNVDLVDRGEVVDVILF
ncbi:MAG: gephyrin-like molybdotransferase Glp [Candidatus Glassbacteria bacterium]